MGRQKTQLCNESFVAKSVAIHGNKYDYSKVNYINNKTKVIVTCPEHGDFLIRPVNHYSINKTGCSRCSNVRHFTQEQWVEEATKTHNGFYDYSLVEYIKGSLKVKIICPKHGEFEQEAQNHKSGAGCYDCRNENHRQTQGDFIRKSVEVHGNKYDYSLVEYVLSALPVKIICPEHGVFEQVCIQHTTGRGCSKCSGQYRRNTDDFIKEAKSVHGNRYDYSLVDFTKLKDRVRIICRVHGEFAQRAYCHLRGYNCPRCPRNNNAPTSVYILSNGADVKVGISNNIERRHYILRLSQPFDSELVCAFTLKDYHEASLVESAVHRELKEYNCGYSGFDGATEWFNCVKDVAFDSVVSNIKKYKFSYVEYEE